MKENFVQIYGTFIKSSHIVKNILAFNPYSLKILIQLHDKKSYYPVESGRKPRNSFGIRIFKSESNNDYLNLI